MEEMVQGGYGKNSNIRKQITEYKRESLVLSKIKHIRKGQVEYTYNRIS